MKKIYLVKSKLGYKAFNSMKCAEKFRNEFPEYAMEIIALEVYGKKDF